MHVILIRHAHSQANAKGILSGRIPGVHLSPTGVKQSHTLTSRLGKIKISALRISPMERCSETISPWWESVGKSCNRNVKVITDPNLIEVDYGSWSGKKLSALSKLKLWKTVQSNPSAMYFPVGEGLAQMQERAMRSVYDSLTVKGKGAVILVSHGDVIKSIIASTLGMHLDNFQRIVIDPASVSVLDFSSSTPRLVLLNDSASQLEGLLNAPTRKVILLGGGAGK